MRNFKWVICLEQYNEDIKVLCQKNNFKYVNECKLDDLKVFNTKKEARRYAENMFDDFTQFEYYNISEDLWRSK